MTSINRGEVTASAVGCEDCERTGDAWVQLRICLGCGHLGCCDDSLNRHASKHARSTGRPIITSYEPGEAWAYCNPHEVTAAAIADPFEQAFFALGHLAYLQGFEDVNRRVSRLAASISLIRGNLCTLFFVDVADRAYIDGVLGVCELNRIELLRDVLVMGLRALQRTVLGGAPVAG
jgi:Zn-finger in ubiquitin-hydrolases and other protein